MMTPTEIILLIGFFITIIYCYYQINVAVKYKTLYQDCLSFNNRYYNLFQQNHSTALKIIDHLEVLKNENVQLNNKIYQLTIENLQLKNSQPSSNS